MHQPDQSSAQRRSRSLCPKENHPGGSRFSTGDMERSGGRWCTSMVARAIARRSGRGQPVSADVRASRRAASSATVDGAAANERWCAVTNQSSLQCGWRSLPKKIDRSGGCSTGEMETERPRWWMTRVIARRSIESRGSASSASVAGVVALLNVAEQHILDEHHASCVLDSVDRSLGRARQVILLRRDER
jgi:hypothetical protein